MVPLHSAGLIPINELSRNEGRFCNNVTKALPLITVQISPFSAAGHRRRGQADVGGHTLKSVTGLFEARQQERLHRIQKSCAVHERTHPNLETHTNKRRLHGSCAGYSESGCWHCVN